MIILDQTVTIGPLIELECLAGKAVALLACRAELVKAKVFRRPKSGSHWISVMDGTGNMRGLYELKPQSPVVDFEVVPRAGSDLVS